MTASMFQRLLNKKLVAIPVSLLIPALVLCGGFAWVLLWSGLAISLKLILTAILVAALTLCFSLYRQYQQLSLFAHEDQTPRLLVDRDGVLLARNNATECFAPLTTPQSPIAFQTLFETENQPCLIKLLDEALRGKASSHRVALKLRNGYHHFSVHCKPALSKKSGDHWLISFTDVTELQTLGDALEQTEQHYQQVVDLTTEALLVLDGNRITYANRSAARLLGVGDQLQLVHRKLREFFTGQQWKKTPKEFRALLKKKSFQLNRIELELCTAQNAPLTVEAIAKPFRFQESQSTLLSLTDIGHQKIQQRQLEHAAHYDDITNLPNRHYFLDQLARVIARSHRSPNEHAVLFIDLDNFKEINDSLGHETGDQVLQEVARRLSNHSRRENTLARLGGDEFSLLIENISSPYDASSAASNIVELLSAPIRLHGHTRWVTPSIGIALYPQNGTATKELLKNADTAMYHAKRSGKNGYRFFSTGMNRTLNRRLQLEQELEDVLTNDKLQTYFQPRVRAEDHKIVGLEALARWQDSQGVMISPEEHLNVAQQSQLIFRFEQEMLRQLCEQLKKWRLLGVSFGTLSLNLSTALLEDSDALMNQLTLLYNEKAPDSQLEIELDAPVLFNGNPRVSTLLDRISRLGFKLAIDHFGSAPTSFPLLGTLPISTIKVNRDLIRAVEQRVDRQRILRTISLTAHSLDMQLSATGIESEQQAHWLQQLGCDLIQGNYFYPPQDAEAITHLLLNRDATQESPSD
ncbi:putative bifunctional diguanylate cyclase/phosphodiesterase [Aestuariirhabdus sp. LZHN29]|uniref:putative bifunctional diguanylate cyclase/phosphodiesterase n=1 Tax=Aestuariirhabdus sp. LZHN29 TaxID=3417462 RepID=UPI003CF50E98